MPNLPHPHLPYKVHQPLRLSLLVVLLGGAIVVLGRAIVTPKPQQAPEIALAWPASVAIDGWQLTQTSPVESLANSSPGQRYEYRSLAGSALALQVELRQALGDGNVSHFLLLHPDIREANAKLQEGRNNDGVYAVLTHKKRAYLSACINPRGGSTVTEQQFNQNHYRHDLQVGRIVPWFMGQEPLLDKRCLWTLMSVPIDSENAAEVATAYKTLETAWSSWVRWWQPNFPPAPQKQK